MRQFLVIQELL